MFLKLRAILVGATITVCGWPAQAQEPGQLLPAGPIPLATAQSPQSPTVLPPTVGLPGPPPPIGLSPSPPAPLPGVIAPFQDRNGSMLGDPREMLLDHPDYSSPGWFTALELDVVGPHVKNRLQSLVAVDGFIPNLVHLPTAQLDWVGAPRVEVGYRFPAGFGELMISYRSLVSEGCVTVPEFDLDGSDGDLKSRLNVNVVDIDYGSREYSIDAHWDLKWRVGARIATAYFDSRAFGVFIEQHESNNFVGGGPHVGLDLWRSLDWPGLGLYARIEGASVVGRISQSFGESAVLEDGTLVGGATLIHHTQAVPSLGIQAGLSWSPSWRRHFARLSTGYSFERWWYLGQAGDSRAELTAQGVFFRAEFAY